jgi:hypothetical protein
MKQKSLLTIRGIPIFIAIFVRTKELFDKKGQQIAEITTASKSLPHFSLLTHK